MHAGDQGDAREVAFRLNRHDLVKVLDVGAMMVLNPATLTSGLGISSRTATEGDNDVLSQTSRSGSTASCNDDDESSDCDDGIVRFYLTFTHIHSYPGWTNLEVACNQ